MMTHTRFRPVVTRAWSAVLASLLIALTPTRGSAQPPSPQADWPTSTAVLELAAARYAGIAGFCAEFRQRIDVGLASRTILSSGTLCQAGVDRFEQRWSDDVYVGDRIVADGTYLWVYFRSADPGQVTRTTLARAGGVYDLHGEFLANPGTRYESFIEGLERVDGREVWAISLRPLTSSLYRRARVWIDRSDHLIRRIVIEQDSDYVRTVDFTDIRLNPALAADWFRFVPARGVQVIEP